MLRLWAQEGGMQNSQFSMILELPSRCLPRLCGRLRGRAWPGTLRRWANASWRRSVKRPSRSRAWHCSFGAGR